MHSTAEGCLPTPWIFRKRPITKKRWKQAIHLTWKSIRLKSTKKTNMSNPIENLGHMKCDSLINLDLLKILATLSDTTIPTSAIDQKTWNHTGNQKKDLISRWLMTVIYKFFKTLLTTKRRLTVQYFLAVDLSTTYADLQITDETFPHSGKQDCFKQILQSLANMYGSSIQDV